MLWKGFGPDISILIAAKSQFAKLKCPVGIYDQMARSPMDVDKSAYHHLSQNEIGGDNPVLDTYRKRLSAFHL